MRSRVHGALAKGVRLLMKALKISGVVLAIVVLILVSLLLPVYFLASSRPGSAMVSGLVQDAMDGKAELDAIWLDPVDGLVGLSGLVLKDPHDRPVVQLGAAWVVPGSWDGTSVEKVRIHQAQLWVKMDEDGKMNLDGLFKEDSSSAPSTPEAFRLDDFGITDSGAVVDGPQGSVAVEGLNLSGSASETKEGVRSGNVDALIDQITVVPAAPDIKDYLGQLLESPDEPVIGPLSARADWNGDKVVLKQLSLSLGPVTVTGQGRLDAQTQLGEISLSARNDGEEAFSLSAHRSKDDWMVSAIVHRLAVPAARLADRLIPGVELTGLRLHALDKLLELSLNRLHIKQLKDEGLQVDGVSISSTLRYESNTPLADLGVVLSEETLPWKRVATALTNWKKGEWVFSMLIDDIVHAKTSLVRPLRLKVNAQPGKEDGFTLHGQLVLHPLGSIVLDFRVHKTDSKGRTPYSLVLTIDSLNLAPLVLAADLPGMVKRMGAGTLEGKIALYAEDLGAARVKVVECGFKLVRPDGGGVSASCPEGEQIWDFSEEPSFSYFTKEVKFGEGILKLEMN